MKIYIPKHLRNIPIIDKFYNIIDAYSGDELWAAKNNDPFSVYQFSLKNDPVKNFLNLALLQNLLYFDYQGISYKYNKNSNSLKQKLEDGTYIEVLENNPSYYNIIDYGLSLENPDINYLSTLFYSVKGTFQVFEYLKSYKVIDANIKYTTRSIDIELVDIGDLADKDYYCKSLENFLSALLYFEKLKINIGSSTVSVSSTLTTKIGLGMKFLKRFKVKSDKL